jgi:transcriptional regulator PpsR
MKAFDAPERTIGTLDAETASTVLASAADVALVLDDDGIIRDLALGSDDLPADECRHWLGKPWLQTVAIDSRQKVEELLSRVAAAAGTARWRHVNQSLAGGAELPFLYATVRLGEGRASSGRTIAFGRDLRGHVALQQRLLKAQQTMERDYWRLRHMETRYRLLFQVASEAVLILDAATLRLEEANPEASRVFGEALRRPGWLLPDSFDAESATTLQAVLAAVRATGRADSVRVRTPDRRELLLSVSLFRQEKTSHFLVRVAPVTAAQPMADEPGRQMLLRVLESAPDAFVVTDVEGKVITANRAFCDLAQLAAEEQARAQSLGTWLGRTGVEMSVLISNLRSSGAVRLFATQLRGALGSTSEVEVSAVSVATDPPVLGFTIRDVGRRLGESAQGARDLPRSVGQMTELVGRVPLKEIVRDTTDMIEQLCIEAALQLTNDNRASAAEMLGLSRQSLYVKMRRYDLGDLVGDADE